MSFEIILLSVAAGLLLDVYLEKKWVDQSGGTLSWSTKNVIRKVIIWYYIVINVLLYLKYFLVEIFK